MIERFRAWLQHFLGMDVINNRLIDLERHFVTKRDKRTGEVLETLATRNAATEQEKAGARKPLAGGHSYQRRRLWEFQDAAQAAIERAAKQRQDEISRAASAEVLGTK